MNVLHVAAELFPVVRTGGLGDVVGALPSAQRVLGIDTRLVVPAYPAVTASLLNPALIASVGPKFGAKLVDIWRGTLSADGIEVYAINAPLLYDRPGNPYLGPDGKDWPDNAARFGLLSWVAAHLASGLIDQGWRADVLHAHDWHAGLAPAYLKLSTDITSPSASVFTVHNLAYQGLFPAETFLTLDLPTTAFAPAGLEFWNQVSFMKAGLVYADRVTTVSPGYAHEMSIEEFGCGLEGVIADRGAAVSGILNGVDEDHWNPRTDPALVGDFDLDTIEPRVLNRQALIERFALDPVDGPLFGVVSRLTEQKGLDLLLGAMPTLLDAGGSLVLLGAGDADLESEFSALAEANPQRVGVELRYDDALSHQIMAGSDAIVVPSRFEPCGLTQLYALRYGAVPIVRRTGGLGDTVVDASDSALTEGTATGIVFDLATISGLSAALDRTVSLFRQKLVWQSIQRAGMERRFLWSDAASEYETLYAGITT